MNYKDFYQENIYGFWRDGEQVSYTWTSENTLDIIVSTVTKQMCKKQISFPVQVMRPASERQACFPGGAPFIICMHPIQDMAYAVEQGYTAFILDTYKVASDDACYDGCFYELYPYGAEASEQTGVLMAWAWAAAKMLDAVYAGLDKELGLDKEASIVTGVSRWGKATAVCGAFDHRFRLVMPACSGAGGLALYGVGSEGNTYDFEAIGGPKEYTYGQNEPLSCLQSEAERGWFCDAFLQYKEPEDIPVDQEQLVVMAANEKHYYFIVAACMGEDWVNAPSMWQCYRRANEVYEQMGLGENLVVHFHKQGHAVLKEDLELMIPYFNQKYYGLGSAVDMDGLKSSVFERR